MDITKQGVKSLLRNVHAPEEIQAGASLLMDLDWEKPAVFPGGPEGTTRIRFSGFSASGHFLALDLTLAPGFPIPPALELLMLKNVEVF